MAVEGPVLVVAAHPDDEVLGCGASCARWAAEGIEVQTLLMGEGISSRFVRQSDQETSGRKHLAVATAEAAKTLGLEPPRRQQNPDNAFDTVPLLELVRHVEEVVHEVQPRTVLTHSLGDLNIDHHLTARAVMTATRPQPGHPVNAVYSFEVASATEYAFGRLGTGPFRPDTYVDVAEWIGTKLRALDRYQDEMRPWPHARSIEAVDALARRRGSEVGREAAEAFETLRSIL